jgi:hypothetical protein
MAKEEALPSDPDDGDTEPGGGSGSSLGGRRGVGDGDRDGDGDKATAPPPTRAAARKATADEQKRTEARQAPRRGKTLPKATPPAATRTGGKAGVRASGKASTAAKATPKAAARSGNPKRAAAAVTESSRYTAPVPRSMKISPWYVPAAMFTFLGLGMLVIFLNYIGFPFGDPSNIRLFIGLGLILLGIITATQYH